MSVKCVHRAWKHDCRVCSPHLFCEHSKKRRLCRLCILDWRRVWWFSQYKGTEKQYQHYINAETCDWCDLPFGNERHTQDHDHNCCAGERPCGKCLRGVVHNSCNRIIGIVETENKLQRLPQYLSKAGIRESRRAET